MLSVNWFWKKCRLARFSERIPLWQSPPQRDGCLVFVTFPTNLHTCDKNQVWVNGSMGVGCFGKRERLEEEREREGLLLMSSHERLSPPPPAPLVLKVWVLSSACFESMSPLFPLFWKYEAFLGPRGPLVEPSMSPSRPPVPSATIFPEFIDEL